MRGIQALLYCRAERFERDVRRMLMRAGAACVAVGEGIERGPSTHGVKFYEKENHWHLNHSEVK